MESLTRLKEEELTQIVGITSVGEITAKTFLHLSCDVDEIISANRAERWVLEEDITQQIRFKYQGVIGYVLHNEKVTSLAPAPEEVKEYQVELYRLEEGGYCPFTPAEPTIAPSENQKVRNWNEIIATAKYLEKLYQICREKGFDKMLSYDWAATGISLLQRAENVDCYFENRKTFKETPAEQFFQKFRKSWRGHYEQEKYEALIEDRKKRYKKQVREPAKVRKSERLEWICNLNQDEVNLMYGLSRES
ncbi:MAG: hypothetical protein AABX04_03795 [Nanoarchaeota archaeon]